MDRRTFVAVSALGVVGCRRDEEVQAPAPAIAAPVAPPPPRPDPGVVRVASVKTAVEGKLLPELIASFERASSYKVRLATGVRVYDLARAHDADLVVSHYGHKDAEAFVLDGLGEWPRTIFSNQMALLGPENDPAGVRDMDDLVAAFAKIAAARLPFVINNLDGVRYLTQILWNAAGRPDRGTWLIDGGTARDLAVDRAAELGGYTLWGLTPWLRVAGRGLVPLVMNDPLLQRMMVSVVTKSGNVEGARAFQSYLLAPATQAAIRTVHYPVDRAVTWVPGGRHNRTAVLPKA